MESILYYPTMDIPDENWLKCTILYWDTVQTIAPEEAFFNREKYGNKKISPYVAEGLIKPVMPSSIFLNELTENDYFTKEFMNFVDTKFQPREQKIIAEKLAKRKSLDQDKEIFTIMRGKLNNVASELEIRGLARRRDDGWYAVPREIGIPFMAYLANVMSFGGKAVPCTNSLNTLKHFSLSRKFKENLSNYNNRDFIESLQMTSMNRHRHKIINEMLVFPAENISPKNIRKFKEKNWELLNNFRKYIEGFLKGIEQLPISQRKSYVDDFIKDGIEMREEIAVKMKEAKFEALKTSNLIMVIRPILDLTQKIPNKDFEALESIVDLAKFSYNVVKNYRNLKRIQLKRPFAYATVFQKTFSDYKFLGKRFF